MQKCFISVPACLMTNRRVFIVETRPHDRGNANTVYMYYRGSSIVYIVYCTIMTRARPTEVFEGTTDVYHNIIVQIDLGPETIFCSRFVLYTERNEK
jgi:hypothetical protein